uniref:Uncharacterized protein n=1 Tax=Anguilla anguilla TaxID=7936 RepID=A0A0E9QBX8_ANGAN
MSITDRMSPTSMGISSLACAA